MSVTRLVWRGADLRLGEHNLPAAVARHARVTRVGVGEAIELLNLEGVVGVGRVLAWRKEECVVVLESLLWERGEPPASLTLGLGVLHTQAFDWAVEKATELGVTRIVPVLASRVQGRRHEARVERWQRIAEAAVAQSGRSRAPLLTSPETLDLFLERPAGLRLLADPGGSGPSDWTGSGAGIAVLVGPEGGLVGAELEAASAAGFERLGLGPRTLRAETAALAALALAQQGAGWL